MNAKELGIMRKKVMKKIKETGENYEARTPIYKKYLEYLNRYLSENPRSAKAISQKAMISSFTNLLEEYPEDMLKDFYNKYKDDLTAKNKALLINNIAYYLFTDTDNIETVKEYLEEAASTGELHEEIIYPLCYIYLKDNSPRLFEYVNFLRNKRPDNLEIMLWEATAYRFNGDLDKSLELLYKIQAVEIKRIVKKYELKENQTINRYNEIVEYNIQYIAYLKGDFKKVKEYLKILERNLEKDEAYYMEVDDCTIFDMYYLIEDYDSIIRIVEHLPHDYYKDGIFEIYLYALAQKFGKEKVSEVFKAYLKEKFKTVQKDMIDEFEEDYEEDEYYDKEHYYRLSSIEHSLEEMHKMTSFYNEIISEDFKPEINEDRLRLYFYIEDCFLKNCLIHEHI